MSSVIDFAINTFDCLLELHMGVCQVTIMTSSGLKLEICLLTNKLQRHLLQNSYENTVWSSNSFRSIEDAYIDASEATNSSLNVPHPKMAG